MEKCHFKSRVFLVVAANFICNRMVVLEKKERKTATTVISSVMI
jgi:hypothetical protein